MGQQEQLQVPRHPFRMQTRSPYSGERCFLTANACKKIQTLPPTRTATSEALLIIMTKTQMQVQLEIWSRYLNSFTLGWWGNNRHSCKSASPSLSLPYTGTSLHYPVEHKYFQWLLCERNLVLSTTNHMMPHRSRIICVPDMLTMQKHEETSCAFWTLKSLLFPFYFCTVYIVNNSKIQFYCKKTVANHGHLSTCHPQQQWLHVFSKLPDTVSYQD